MTDWVRAFSEYIAAVFGGVGVALIAALIALALSRVTFPTLRQLWCRASPLGRLFGTLLFLICSINATTKAPSRNVPKRVAMSVSAAAEVQSTRIEKWFCRGAWRYSGDDNPTVNVFTQYEQRFELDANGTARIKKFGYCAERATNNVHNIKGGTQ